MIIRWSVLLVVVAALVSAVASSATQDATAGHAATPKPLRGVPLTGSTGLKLLVAGDPPSLLDVDSGQVTPLGGLDVHGSPVLSVFAVGRDAIVWLDRRTPAKKSPTAEIYVVHHDGTTSDPDCSCLGCRARRRRSSGMADQLQGRTPLRSPRGSPLRPPTAKSADLVLDTTDRRRLGRAAHRGELHRGSARQAGRCSEPMRSGPSRAVTRSRMPVAVVRSR